MDDAHPLRWISVLGPIALVSAAGPEFAPRREVPRTLLALIAARFGRVWPAAELAEALWGDEPPARPAAALQSQVFRLRRALGPAGGWVETVGAGYRLGGPVERVDAALFEHLARAAGRAAGAAALHDLERALGLWRGRAYADAGEHPILLAEAARLNRVRLDAEQARVELLLQLGQADRAASAAADLVVEEPYAEAPVRLLGAALAACGRHADALAEFRALRLRLREELAIEPTSALRLAEEAVLRHLDPRPRAAAIVRLPGNSFVGRDGELADLVERIGRHRVVVVVGPGGVGKTRLALHAAALAADRYPDGMVVCELATAGVDDVASAVASTLQLERRAGQSALERTVDFLRLRRMLLVLDNCEHVLGGVRELLRAVGDAAPDVAVLATSRIRLGTPAESVVELSALKTDSAGPGPAPAVELFVDRLRALRAGLELDAEGMAAIATLARWAGGLPLAVELATARCLTRSPIDLAAEWDARGGAGELGSRPDTVDPHRSVERHRSIEAMVEWSFDLLPPEQQALFETVSVFAGGWDAAAAATLAGGGTDLSGALSGLVEQSLVGVGERPGGLRYSMLEPVRQFAQERLASRTGLASAQGRHAAWAAEFVEAAEVGLRSAQEGRWHRRIEGELANLRAAHRWALGADPVLALRLAGQYWFALWHSPAEVLDRVDETVERHGQLEHPSVPAALATAAVGAWRRGDLTQARILGERAVAMAPDPSHPTARFGWEALADAELFDGAHDRALICYDTAIEAGLRGDDEAFVVDVSLSRALCLGYAERVEEAAAAIAAIRDAVDRLANPTCLAFADYVTAEATMPGQAGYAVRLLERAAGVAAAARSDFLADECLLSAAARRVAAGDAAAAAGQLHSLVGRWHRAGNWNQQWTTLAVCVDALGALDRPEEAALLAAAVARSGSLVAGVSGAPVTAGPRPSADATVRYALEALDSVLLHLQPAGRGAMDSGVSPTGTPR